MKDLNHYIYFKKPWKGQAGTVLIGLIVTMVFLSALAAAMIAQTTTGSLGFVNENSSLRAYYLAESGFRYAAAKLKHKASMDDLHSQSFSLGNKGSFSLEFTTYIFEVTGGIGTNELVTKVSFGKAPLLTGSGYVKVGNLDLTFDAVTIDASPNDNVVRFTSAQPWNVFVGEDVKLVVKSNGAAVSEGGDLILDSSADAFPPYNGRFKADSNTYQYKKRETGKLVGITCVGSWVAPSPSAYIILQAFTQLSSTGTYGEGDMAVSRKIVYNIPLSTFEKSEFHDTFETKDNWEQVSTLGSHGIETIGGDKALKVTGTTSVGVTDVGSLIKLDSSKVDTMLERSHSSTGNFLSYDTQVKIGFDPGVPSTYMAGISFRQDAEGNSYGVSFLKAESSDGIPDDLCPDFNTKIITNVPLLVLWQQTNAGTAKKWLAYKDLIGRPIYLSDDMESGINGWSADGLWNITDHRYKSSSHSWYYGQSGIWHYDTGATNSGNLTSPSIDLTTASSPSLTFWSWYKTENVSPYDPNEFDCKYVDIYDGSSWHEKVFQITYPKYPMETWKQVIMDLSPYIGKTIKIRFRFDTKDPSYNSYEGWYIDDVIVAEDFPINEASLMVRVKEAATLSFTGGGATPIEAGDIVYQATGRGTVLGTPILESGSWTVGGNAAGIILLNKISGSFTAGQPLYVDGTALATTASVAGFYRARDNYIRVYYGDKNGYGTPGVDPLDYDKHGNPRGEVHWPPDEVEDWSAANDYFTLVQWDEVNSTVSSLDKVSSIDEPDAILRTNELTTSTGALATEIGLHTFGNYSTRVYFDDFWLQIDVPTSEGFLPAVQQ